MAKPRIPALGQVGDEIVDQTLPQFGIPDDQDGSDDSESAPSSLDALHSLLTNGAQYTPPPAVDGGSRNAAITGALSAKYGLGPDKGAISQQDLEALDTFMRGADVRDAISKAVAPIDAKGQYDLADEGMKDQSAQTVEGMRGQSAQNVAEINNEGKIGAVEAKGGGTPGADPATIDGLAKSAALDFHGTMGSVPNALKPAVLQRLYQIDSNPQSPTNQTKQMSEAANDILDVMDRNNFAGQATDLNNKGLFAPGLGWLRRTASQHGMASLMGVDDATAGQIGQFESTHDLLMSALARAHAGARGAGNNGMADRFEKIMNDQGDIPTFLGDLQGIRGLLEQYASHVNPNRGFSSAGDDLGADWGNGR